eukprot:3220051-Ditylum_brightwellii.AAC.1
MLGISSDFSHSVHLICQAMTHTLCLMPKVLQNATNPSINSAPATTLIVPNAYTLSTSAHPLCQCAISILSSTA